MSCQFKAERAEPVRVFQIPGDMDLPPMTMEALAELDAAGAETAEKEKSCEKEKVEEPKRKRLRRISVPDEPG